MVEYDLRQITTLSISNQHIPVLSKNIDWDKELIWQHMPHSFWHPHSVLEEGEYVYVREKLNWYKAREYCQSNYTELARVRNATENDKIFAVLESDAWIGLHRYPWSHWSDGSKATYWNWQIYQPDNYLKKQHCVHMNVTSGYFDDLECGSLHYVACQERQKQCSSTFRLKISSEADMTDPKVQHKFVEQVGRIMWWHACPNDCNIFKWSPTFKNVEKSNVRWRY